MEKFIAFLIPVAVLGVLTWAFVRMLSTKNYSGDGMGDASQVVMMNFMNQDKRKSVEHVLYETYEAVEEDEDGEDISRMNMKNVRDAVNKAMDRES